MLEPERTGLHEQRRGHGTLIAIIVALVLAAVALVVVTQVL